MYLDWRTPEGLTGEGMDREKDGGWETSQDVFPWNLSDSFPPFNTLPSVHPQGGGTGHKFGTVGSVCAESSVRTYGSWASSSWVGATSAWSSSGRSPRSSWVKTSPSTSGTGYASRSSWWWTCHPEPDPGGRPDSEVLPEIYRRVKCWTKEGHR